MGCNQSTERQGMPASTYTSTSASTSTPPPPPPLTAKEVQAACRSGDSEVLVDLLGRTYEKYAENPAALSLETDPLAVAHSAGLDETMDTCFELFGSGSAEGSCSLEHFLYMLDVAWEAESASLLERVVDAFPSMLHPFDPWELWDDLAEYLTSCALAVLSVACKVGSVEIASRVLTSIDFNPKEALRTVDNTYYQRVNWSDAYPGGVRYVTPKTRRSREEHHRFDFEETYGEFNRSRERYNPFVLAKSVEILELLLSDFRLSPIAHDNLPLKKYIQRGRVDLLEVLIADPRVDWQKPGLLDQAVFSRRPEVIEFMLDRADATALSRRGGENLLKEAAITGEPAVLEALLARLPNEWKVSAWIKSVAEEVLCRSESVDGMFGMMEPLLASGLRPELGSELAYLVVTMSTWRYPELPNRRADFLQTVLADPRFDPAGCNNAAIKAAAKSGHDEIISLLMSDPRVNPPAGSPPAYSSEQKPPPAYEE